VSLKKFTIILFFQAMSKTTLMTSKMYRLCGKDVELVWCNNTVTLIIYAIVLINNPLYGLTV